MEHKKPIVSPFPEELLQHFTNLLLDKRKTAVEQLNILNRTIANLAEADDADYSSVAHHMGDVGTDVEEEELNYQLQERTKKFIEEIDDALDRINNGTYGICQATGKIIERERLESVPHTRYSIDAKEHGLAEPDFQHPHTKPFDDNG